MKRKKCLPIDQEAALLLSRKRVHTSVAFSRAHLSDPRDRHGFFHEAISSPLPIFPPGYVHVVFPRDFHVLVSVGFGWNRERRRRHGRRRKRGGKRGNPLPFSKGRGSYDEGRVGGEERERGRGKRVKKRERKRESGGGERRRSSTLIGVEQRRRRRLVPGDKIGALPLPLQPARPSPSWPIARIFNSLGDSWPRKSHFDLGRTRTKRLSPQDLPSLEDLPPAFSTWNRRRSGARSCPGDKGWLCDDE